MRFAKHILIFLLWLLLSCPSFGRKKVATADSLRCFVSKGDSCMADFDYRHAVDYFLRAMNSGAADTLSRRLAECYRRMGDHRRCIDCLHRISDDSLTHKDCRLLYYAYSSLGKADSLEYWGKSIVRLWPNDGEIVASLANWYNERQLPEKAIRLASSYRMRDTTNLAVNRQYGYGCYLDGKDSLAISVYNALLRQGFDNYETHLILGICYRNEEQPSKAYEHLKKAVAAKNNDFFSLSQLGKVCLELSENSMYAMRPPLYNEAAECFAKAVAATTPDSVRLSSVYKDLAEAHYLCRDYKSAANAFERAALYAPEDALIYYNVAQMYRGVEDWAQEERYSRLFLEKSVGMKDNSRKQELVQVVQERLHVLKRLCIASGKAASAKTKTK